MALKKTIPKKSSGGRPCKFLPVYNTQAEKLCRLGATDKEIADFFQITESTLNEWKLKRSGFSEALKRGKILADAEVADKLYQRATGYSHPDVDIRVIKNKVVVTKLTKHYPPDTIAAIFWLKNRQKETWRDKVEQDITTKGQSINKPLSEAQLEKVLTEIRKSGQTKK